MKPNGVSQETWDKLTGFQQKCAHLVEEEDFRRLMKDPRSVWPEEWSDLEVKQARQTGRKVLDPRIGQR